VLLGNVKNSLKLFYDKQNIFWKFCPLYWATILNFVFLSSDQYYKINSCMCSGSVWVVMKMTHTLFIRWLLRPW